jgi:hypothetical protein
MHRDDLKRFGAILLAAAGTLLTVPAGAVAAGLPAGFIGISPQSVEGPNGYGLMAKAGIKTVRLPLHWTTTQAESQSADDLEWGSFDHAVALAATAEMRVFPFVWGTPAWMTASQEEEPANRWALGRWAAFLKHAARRYGPFGDFWEQNPGLPYLPVLQWELWNEPNIVSYSRRPDPARFARLLKVGARALRSVDRDFDVILGGLFGRPLQQPPNIGSSRFLAAVYKVPGAARHFDGVGLHPYVPDASALGPMIGSLRRVMRRHGDGRTKLYITEMGWGSDSYESRWERGWDGQARELHQAMELFSIHRHRWRLGGVYWYSWRDQEGACQFCDSAGLMTEDRLPKPAWYRFNFWTGGDPAALPRSLAFPAR